MAPFAIEQGSADEPNQNADGTPNPQARLPLRLRNWGPTNEPLRADTVQADFATPVTYTTGGGAIVSTRDAVSFSFGLEQVDQATRNELVRRTMSYLLPTTADTTAPTIVGFKYPPNLSTGTPRDPVDIELTDVRRAWRHGLRRPQGRRPAHPAHRGLPVPVPLHPAGLGRRFRGHADRRGGRLGRQQVHA